MRAFICSARELRWGSAERCRRALSDIRRCEENSAGLVCITRHSGSGYLFHVVTREGRCYGVTFMPLGFTLNTLDHNNTICATRCFPSICSVLEHMKTNMNLTFVPRQCPVLKDLCCEVVNRCDIQVPPGLRVVTACCL